VWHGSDCGHDTERCDVVRDIVAQEKARDVADSQTRDVSPDSSDPRGSSAESDAARGTSPYSDVRAGQSGSSDDLASAGRRDVSPDSDSSSDSGNASPGDSASSGTLTRPPPTKRARHDEPGDRRRYENETQSYAPAARSR